MRKLTINGHKMPCRCCGRNAKHIFDLGWRIGVYCDRHYETTVQFAEIVEFYTSMSDEYQIHKDVLTSGYTGVMNGVYDPLSYMKELMEGEE